MTATEAIKYMEITGKSVKLVDPTLDPINNRGYWKLYWHDRVVKLLPDVPCAARVWINVSVEEFLAGSKHEYEAYER